MVDRKIDISKKYQSALRNKKMRVLVLRTEKYCRHCDTVKPIDDFYQPSLSGLTKISCWCKLCIIQYAHERYVQRRIERDLRKHKQR